ncbi:MAG: 5'/3'-nucleotidase SurE [Roseburia sp.]
MRILITNDDGINAIGIHKLAEMAKKLGEVWVVAPEGQCSAMSQKITVSDKIRLAKAADFPVSGVKAYRLGGTPADCVKVAVEYLMKEKPDVVFSGINNGYNAGIEVSYSGTVAAAMEALLKGIPAIAFSTEANGIYDVVDANLFQIAKELVERPAGAGKIWNVNFPGCSETECKGILYERTLANTQYFLDSYEAEKQEDGSELLDLQGKRITSAGAGTDLQVLIERYISIGTIRNVVIG